jgi:hydrogenase-4 component B
VSVRFLLELFFVLCSCGVAAGCLLSNRSVLPLVGWLGSAASITMFTVGTLGVVGQTFSCRLWRILPVGRFAISVDPLSGLFLCVSALVFFSVSLYSMGYLKHYLDAFSMRAFCACYFGMLISVALVLLAADVMGFLIGWELMSIIGYLLVNCQRRGEENARPGYMMLTMGEAGFMAVTLAFLILAARSNDLSFSSLRTAGLSVGFATRWSIFLLSFFGLGVKTGLIPFNRWLPKAHPVAPANVSAFLSGALLNLGVYGIARLNLDLAPVTTAGPGLIVLATGTLTALVGILYANRENDMKTMLAESSIENMGIVTAGLGVGMVFFSVHFATLAGMAFVAALYHMTNHSVYKSLLFFGAGSVDVAMGTRNMNRLGGLVAALPWTSACFLVGALSISALPPFSGFVSEWLTLQTLLQSATLRSSGVKVVFALCGATLALTAALAVTCFVKTYAMSFLGVSRSNEHRPHAHTHRSVKVAMGFLAILCLALGILPTYAISFLDHPVSTLAHATTIEALVPPFFSPGSKSLPAAFTAEFHDLGAQVGSRILPGRGLVLLHRGEVANPVVFAMSTSYGVVVLGGLLISVYLLVRRRGTHETRCLRKPVWAGGLASLFPELTYTATGFSNPVAVTFSAIFHPTQVEDSSEMVGHHFRMAIRRLVEEVHVVDRLVLAPANARIREVANRLASMHHGRLNSYAAYILATFLTVLLVARIPATQQFTLSPAVVIIIVLLADRVL